MRGLPHCLCAYWLLHIFVADISFSSFDIDPMVTVANQSILPRKSSKFRPFCEPILQKKKRAKSFKRFSKTRVCRACVVFSLPLLWPWNSGRRPAFTTNSWNRFLVPFIIWPLLILFPTKRRMLFPRETPLFSARSPR